MSTPTLDLSTATDAEIEAAVAEHCAGFKNVGVRRIGDEYVYQYRVRDVKIEGDDRIHSRLVNVPHYLTNANAIVELLNIGYDVEIVKSGVKWVAWIGKSYGSTHHDGSDKSFCKACSIALLRAAGVNVTGDGL